jgi:iron transport multicopper oxidase
MFDKVPDGLNNNVTSWLVYDSSKPLPAPQDLAEFDPFDDFTLVPQDNQTLFPPPDKTLTMTISMQNLKDGKN